MSSAKTKPIKVVLFLGSVRIGRMGERVATFMRNHLEKKGFKVDFFDPKELKFPVLENPVHFYPDPAQAPQWLKELDARVRDADAYVLVSGEYNNCIPPALTNMMNHFPPNSYAFKPSLIVSYSVGRFGGVTAASQLRTFTSMLGCPSVPLVMAVSEVMKALDESGKPQLDYLDTRAQKAVEQLDWMASALKDKRLKDGAPEFTI